MRDENSLERDTAITDKKERLLRIWWKVAYILVALASALSVILMMVGPDRVVAFEGQDALTVYFYALMPASVLAMLVLTVMNIARDYPRLMMLFAGSSVFFSIRYLTLGWVSALLLLCAGLAAFVLTAIRQCKRLRDEPHAKVKGKMLIIAAVLAILYACYQGYISLLNAMAYAAYGLPENSTYYFFSGLSTIAFNLALAAACFMKNRPTSVFYRMFFLGAALVLALQTPISWIGADLSATGLFGYLQIAVSVAVLAIAVLVILHALLTRKQTAAGALAAGETEEETEAAEEEADEIDETIGLYREEGEIDETIGLYKEDEAEKSAEGDSAQDGQ